jgi:hypothetical protein
VKLHQEYSLYQDSFPEDLGSSREGLISAIVYQLRCNSMAPVPADRCQIYLAAMLRQESH